MALLRMLLRLMRERQPLSNFLRLDMLFYFQCILMILILLVIVALDISSCYHMWPWVIKQLKNYIQANNLKYQFRFKSKEGIVLHIMKFLNFKYGFTHSEICHRLNEYNNCKFTYVCLSNKNFIANSFKNRVMNWFDYCDGTIIDLEYDFQFENAIILPENCLNIFNETNNFYKHNYGDYVCFTSNQNTNFLFLNNLINELTKLNDSNINQYKVFLFFCGSHIYCIILNVDYILPFTWHKSNMRHCDEARHVFDLLINNAKCIDKYINR